MSGDRGQALVLAVLVLAVAALAVGGLRLAQERILAAHTERSVYEAAVEAAAAVVADAVADGREVRDAAVADRARSAALELAPGGFEALTVGCVGRWVEVTIVARGVTYRAALEAECSPR